MVSLAKGETTGMGGVFRVKLYFKGEILTLSRWSNLVKFLPLVRARIVSGHHSEKI